MAAEEATYPRRKVLIGLAALGVGGAGMIGLGVHALIDVLGYPLPSSSIKAIPILSIPQPGRLIARALPQPVRTAPFRSGTPRQDKPYRSTVDMTMRYLKQPGRPMARSLLPLQAAAPFIFGSQIPGGCLQRLARRARLGNR